MVSHMKTTIEITDELLERAREAARRERTTLRALVEEGLRTSIEQRRRGRRFQLRDASVGGQGLAPEFHDASWERIRDAAYGGSGS